MIYPDVIKLLSNIYPRITPAVKTVFNYRLQNRTGTCSRNTPRSSLAGRGDTPWVPIVGEYQRLSRQSCLLKPKQTAWSTPVHVHACARVIPVHYPGVKQLCATPHKRPKSALRHKIPAKCAVPQSSASVSYPTTRCPVWGTSPLPA